MPRDSQVIGGPYRSPANRRTKRRAARDQRISPGTRPNPAAHAIEKSDHGTARLARSPQQGTERRAAEAWRSRLRQRAATRPCPGCTPVRREHGRRDHGRASGGWAAASDDHCARHQFAVPGSGALQTGVEQRSHRQCGTLERAEPSRDQQRASSSRGHAGFGDGTAPE